MMPRPPAQRMGTRSEKGSEDVEKGEQVASRQAGCLADLLAMGVAAVCYGVSVNEA